MPYAESVADLVVAALGGRPAPEAIRQLDEYRRRAGGRHVPNAGTEIARQVREVVRRWRPPLGVVAASAVPHGQAADVRLELAGGQLGWIQIKAQLTKDSFAELTQADWEQDFTAALAKLAQDDATFDRRLTPAYRARLAAIAVPRRWSLSDLVIADICGLPEAVRAAGAGVDSPADLRAFLPHSYLLQVTREGARLVPHRDFACIAAYLAGAGFEYLDLGPDRRALTRIWCAWGFVPQDGEIHWQYYPYDYRYHRRDGRQGKQVWGRHKLNARGVGNPPGAIVVPARP